jgi:tetratricopeptide (TPR) repeat protein
MSRPRTVFVCVLLALITLSVYLPVRHYAFVNYDDPDYLTENPVVQAGLTWAGVKYAFTTLAYVSNWHPLVWLSFMLDCQLFGLNAGWLHLVNVFFHAVNAVLLFLLLLRLTSAFWQSAFIAALFAWHPLRVESVAWVTERKDVLFLFFGLLTLMAYVRYVHGVNSGMWQVTQTNSIRSRVMCPASRYYWLALLFFALGLMAKPMLVTLPFVFLLLDYWPLRRVTGDKKSVGQLSTILEKWPFFVLAAASCVVTFIAQQLGQRGALQEPYPIRLRLGNTVVAYVKYLFSSVCPVNLAVIYPLPKEIPLVQIAGAMIVLGMISWLVWRRRRYEPYLLTGWLWFLGTMLPVIGLTQVGAGNAAMADRYTYFPQIGLLIGATFCIGHWAARLRLEPMVMISVAVIILAGCLLATARQLQYWRDGEALFERALAVTKDNPVAQYNLGLALGEAGHPQEAMDHFREALRLSPDYAAAHINLGVALTRTGHLQEAIEHLEEALRLKPDDALTHNNLGGALLQTGQPQEALEHFREALRLKPDYAAAHYNLGDALLQTGQPQEALEHFREVLRLKPDDALAHNNLGRALAQTGQPQEAIKYYQEALRLQPNLPEAQYDLGHALLQAGQPREAIEHFREALRLKPDDAPAHNDLGVALAQTGQPQEAIEHFQEALRLKPDYAMTHNNLGVALAQTGQPQEAIKHYQEALRLQPNLPEAHCDLGITLTEIGRLTEAITHFERALQLEPNFSKAHNGLGLALLQNGQVEEAIAQFRTALQLQPDFTAARNQLGDALIKYGYVLFQKGQMNQAIVHLQEGLQIRPGNAEAYNCLGFIFLKQGQAGAAVADFQKALELQPNNVDAHKYLAWILAACPDASVRNGARAIESAQQAEQLSGGKDPAIITILAAAYAEAGRFPDAMTTAQKALALATAQTNTAVADALQTQIKCYQAGSPFRDRSLTNTLSSESQP